jgi:hypothetical protein
MTGATLTLKNIIILELYHVLNLIFVWLCSSKGRKIKTRLYGAIWHGAFMACFAYNACLEGGSQCAGGLIGIGLRQQYSDLLFPCGSQIQSILLYLSQSQCIILCFKPMKLQVSILQKMLELYVAEGKPLPSVLFLQVI